MCERRKSEVGTCEENKSENTSMECDPGVQVRCEHKDANIRKICGSDKGQSKWKEK